MSGPEIMADEFALWQAHPVTRWVFTGIARAIEQDRAEWVRASWGNGVASPEYLAELRFRALALSELATNDFDTWSEWNAEPERD